jgi:mono/diheme cytochrome c family protein
LSAKPAPAYPFEIDSAKAGEGEQLFADHCARCHASDRTGTVVALAEIGTDRERMDTWNEKAAAEANEVVDEMGIERKGLVEEPLSGYVAQFLDGIWLRAPYLHNGSVPTLYDLLLPVAQRPVQFYRGYNVYDPLKVGYISQGKEAEHAGTLHDTRARANSAQGHEFGGGLSEQQRWALLEYMKTL